MKHSAFGDLVIIIIIVAVLSGVLLLLIVIIVDAQLLRRARLAWRVFPAWIADPFFSP